MIGNIELTDVDVRFGEARVLRGISLSIAPGEMVALVGPSGAGKTTLLRLVNASAVASAGRVRVGGLDLADLDASALRRLRSRVGMVHQDLRLVPNLRVSQNILAGGFGRQGFWGALRAMLRPPGADLERAHALLQRVGVAEKLFHRVDRLSGGQQQRVAIARALYQRPVILLADEPVASVDPARARDVVELLVRLAREDGRTLIMSLHNLDLAREFFPRLIGLREGALVCDGPPSSLSDPRYADLYRLADHGGASGDT